MQQKTKLILLLIIGLISSHGLMSCKKIVDYTHHVDFIYDNESSENLQIDCYSYYGDITKSILFDSKSQLTGKADLTSGSGAVVGVALPCQNLTKLVINFDDNEIVWLPDDMSPRNPLLLENYNVISNSNGTEAWHFTFVNSDFEN